MFRAGGISTILVFFGYLATCSLPVARADEPATVKVTRGSAFVGRFATLDIYINDRLVGSVRNNETKKFDFSRLTPGKNELRVVEDSAFGKFTFYQNALEQKGDKKYFLFMPGEEVAIKVGANDDNLKDNFFQVSNEVASDWTSPTVVSVKLDTDLTSVVTKRSPPIRVADNIGKEVDDTVRVKHIAAISESWKSEAGVQAGVKAGWFSIGTEIKQEIEKVTSTTYEVERERKRKVTVTPREAEYVRVVWVNYYRTGTVTTTLNGNEVSVPFKFWDDFDLLMENVPSSEKK